MSHWWDPEDSDEECEDEGEGRDNNKDTGGSAMQEDMQTDGQVRALPYMRWYSSRHHRGSYVRCKLRRMLRGEPVADCMRARVCACVCVCAGRGSHGRRRRTRSQ